jgi:hypothetical protein
VTHAVGLRRAAWVLPAIAALLAIAEYARLLPGGRWQADDYLGAAFVAHGDWAIIIHSLRWAPRLISTLLTGLYFTASHALGRPLIVSFLATLWMACAGATICAGWAAGVRRPVLMALTLFALTLLLSKPGEMFYWPVGAAAYLPCWAGLAAATMLHRGAVARHGRALMLALLVGALSTEIGAATVLLYAALTILAGWRARDAKTLVWLVPAAVAAAVCAQVLLARIKPMGEVMVAGNGLAGHWPASLAAALPDFARDLAGIQGLPLAAGAVVKLAVLVSMTSGAPQAEGAWRRMVPWAGALLVAAFASTVLAYHQFGMPCCERHSSFRQGMIVLAITSLAGLVRGPPAVVRQVGLTALLCGLLMLRSGALRADYRGLPAVIAARQRTWQSGRGPGDEMSLYLSPPARITNWDSLPAGSYTRRTDVMWGDGAWYSWGIMATFGKHKLTIVPSDK